MMSGSLALLDGGQGPLNLVLIGSTAKPQISFVARTLLKVEWYYKEVSTRSGKGNLQQAFWTQENDQISKVYKNEKEIGRLGFSKEEIIGLTTEQKKKKKQHPIKLQRRRMTEHRNINGKQWGGSSLS